MKRLILLTALGMFALVAGVAMAPRKQGAYSPPRTVYASPIQGGCYIAAPSDCRLHVDPFTINLLSGTKVAQFKLVAIRSSDSIQTTIYDFRPDQSNPAPSSGPTYTPSLVAQDFAATCGQSYEISLQGKASDDVSLFNLGLTGIFTCPSNVP